MVREKRDIRPVILKSGVALALSLGGIIFAFFGTKRIDPSNSSSSPNSGGKKGELKNDDQTKSASGNSVSEFPWRYEDVAIPKIVIGSSISGPSTNCRSGGDTDGLLLLEINEPVKEFGSSPKASFSPCKDVEMPLQDADSPKEYKIIGRDDHAQEIENLKNIVKTLKERETTLENQLLEYYGLKEEENSIVELQNRLRIHNPEAKHLSLKIESLTAEKMKLKAQVTDSAKVVSDLHAAKLKIKQLEMKLGLEADRNKEEILSLKERVMKLQDEEKNPVEAESDVQLELQKLKDLEREADELRKSNQSLRAENSTLAEKLEYVQIPAISVLEDDVTEALKEESLQLRKKNEDLAKRVEQLQAGGSSEMVHGTSNKNKIFRKLMRLLRGKDHHHNQSSSEMVHSTEENAVRCSNYSFGYSSDTAVIDTGAIRLQSRSSTSSQGSSKQFIDFHSFYPGSRSNKGGSRNYPTRTRRYSDVGSLDYISKRLGESPQEKGNSHDPENVPKSELAKYAEVLKGSHSKAPVRKRSASVSFC